MTLNESHYWSSQIVAVPKTILSCFMNHKLLNLDAPLIPRSHHRLCPANTVRYTIAQLTAHTYPYECSKADSTKPED